MKAGRAGSTPDGIYTSQPLKNLLDGVGRAVFSLNSIVVGLDAVESGYPKPTSLDISWNPIDRKLAARIARHFALESALVTLSATTRSYFDAVGKLSRFKGVYSENDKAAEKVFKISKHCLGKDYHTVIPSLVVHWRNRVVHGSSAKLRSPEKILLIENEAEISDRYASLSITCLLCHFEEGRPTLKDVSSLVSMCINLARKLDEIIGFEISPEDLNALLAHYGILEKIEQIKANTKPEKVPASIERVFKAHAPLLFEPFERLIGIVPAS